MSVARIIWRGAVSSLSGPRTDTATAAPLPIPSVGAIRGLIGSAMGRTDGYRGHLDLAVVVHDHGEPVEDFRTARLNGPRTRRKWIGGDGKVRERGGDAGKALAISERIFVCGFRATLLAGPDGHAIDTALRRPIFVPYLGSRDAVSPPMAGGVIDGDIDEALSEVEPGTVYRLTTETRFEFGVDLVALPERSGALSFWSRT
ncbi:MAG: CRISPR-associated protein Cas5 [Paracoccaceae bacterium]